MQLKLTTKQEKQWLQGAWIGRSSNANDVRSGLWVWVNVKSELDTAFREMVKLDSRQKTLPAKNVSTEP